jgi:hypothetical protein
VGLEVTICDLQFSSSSFESRNAKSSGKRSILRLFVAALGVAAAISPSNVTFVFDFLSGQELTISDSVLSVLRFDQIALGFLAMILGAFPVFVSMRVWLPLWLVGLLPGRNRHGLTSTYCADSEAGARGQSARMTPP